MKYSPLLIVVVLYCCSSNYNDKNNNVLKKDSNQVMDTLNCATIQSDSIKKYSKKMKKFYMNVEPSEIAEKWFLPFNIQNRSDLNMIQIISGFGTYRSGHAKGHKHSGIDILPSDKKDTVFVYPINKGIVCLIRPIAPNKTVIIRHKLNDGSFIYSSYIHLKEIFVKNGDEVDYNTSIGLLYTKSEAKRFNGNYDHLHFEIKKRIDDYCCASWLCMSQEELSEYFENPLDFLKKNLTKQSILKK